MTEPRTEKAQSCTCGHRKAQHHMDQGWCCAPVSPSRTCACDMYESAHRTETAQVQYVVGFALDNRHRVALIRKNRPEWQAGRLNGIGGHVEPGESLHEAMVREFQEETGRLIPSGDRFLTMEFPGAIIHFYRAHVGYAILDGLRTTTDETVCVIDSRDLGQAGVIPNLTWLVPLAAYTADTYDPIYVHAAMAEVVLPPAQTSQDGAR